LHVSLPVQALLSEHDPLFAVCVHPCVVHASVVQLKASAQLTAVCSCPLVQATNCPAALHWFAVHATQVLFRQICLFAGQSAPVIHSTQVPVPGMQTSVAPVHFATWSHDARMVLHESLVQALPSEQVSPGLQPTQAPAPLHTPAGHWVPALALVPATLHAPVCVLQPVWPLHTLPSSGQTTAVPLTHAPPTQLSLPSQALLLLQLGVCSTPLEHWRRLVPLAQPSPAGATTEPKPVALQRRSTLP
jgi:hypothetical protein